MIKKLYNLIQTINVDPLTMKKAALLCFFVVGIRFAASWFLYSINMSFGIMPDIAFLVSVLITARMMGKDELRRIFAWRDIPLPVFAGIIVMFFGFEIITSELFNIFYNILPIPEGFFDGWFYKPQNVFLVILTSALFPGFTEEIFFRGILSRRFCRNYPPIKAILLSAALFGIFHLNPWQAVNAFYAGIFYGWIYWRYKSIWPCMFAHAYHNVLAHYMSLPYIDIDGYSERWRHPVWFDIMGLFLFGFGLLTVIVLSRKKAQDVQK